MKEEDLVDKFGERFKSELEEADKSEGYLIAFWYLKDGKRRLYRKTKKWPNIENKSAVKQLLDDLRSEEKDVL